MKMKIRNFALMTHDEYKANISGLNIFFGAILGVVMADVSVSSALQYSLLLAIIASYIIMLLYVSASKHRLRYAVLSTAALLYAWFKILLSVWLILIIVIEFSPRGSPESSDDE